MQNKLPQSLFFKSATETPIVFDANTVARRESPPILTFKFKKGIIALSKGLLLMLGAAETKRISFVNYKGSGYITCVDKGGHWLSVQTRTKSGVCSAIATNKPLVRETLRDLGHGPDETIAFPIAPHPVTAAELHLDPTTYKNPLYRIVLDQKIIKS